MNKTSAVLVVRNEEGNILRCLNSVSWVDEIIVVDMESTDKTVEMVKKFTDKIYSHPQVGFADPARNFAIEKATGPWILMVDADEEIPSTLTHKLKELAQAPAGNNFFRIPRKNIIFGKWIKHSRWWPDYVVRFFKKEAVSFLPQVHGVPLTRGEGKDLEEKEEEAIIHHNYQTVSQFLERLNRYTSEQVRDLTGKGYRFKWQDLMAKPTNEFLGRFFVGEGYKDGIHGLALASLQAFSELVLYLKVWEKEGFSQEPLLEKEMAGEIRESQRDFNYWLRTSQIKEAKGLKRVILKIFRRLRV